MSSSTSPPEAITPELTTTRLRLSPVGEADAPEMVGVLVDSILYQFTGGVPPDLPQLEARYRAQAAGSPDPTQVWHNWIIRFGDPQIAVGFVQATVEPPVADVAWVVGVDWQGRGIATEAASAIHEWLVGAGIARISAHIHPDHMASERVATKLGMRPTGELDADGEMVWRLTS